MSNPIHYVALVLVIICLWITPAILIARHAAGKGHNFPLFLTASLLTPWPIMLMIAVLVPGRLSAHPKSRLH
jgi:hypothetical protein